MSLRVDLEKAMVGLRDTLHKLDDDIAALENVIKDHFELTSNKVPTKVIQNIEKDIKQWPSTTPNPQTDRLG